MLDNGSTELTYTKSTEHKIGNRLSHRFLIAQHYVHYFKPKVLLSSI